MMKVLTLPFGISSDESASDVLLIGHVLDDLLETMKPGETIDCLDVAAIAYNLGHEPAGNFLDEAPWIIFKMNREFLEEHRH